MNRIARVVSFVVLLTALAGAQEKPFKVDSVVNEPAIAGRPVQLDAQGKLLPWPMPNDIGYSYSSHFLSQWTLLWDQYNRQRLPWFYCCFDFDRTTFELTPDLTWVNSTGYLRAMMEGYLEHLYAYTGDDRTITFIEGLVDYELDHGLTPADYAWAQVPYASASPGAKQYSGWNHMGEDYLEPHVVGEDGYGYLRLYELTGNVRYLQAAIRCAEALVKNYHAGDETHSPWPVRCFARDGKIGTNEAMGPYSANVIEPIMLFDELIRIGQGNVTAYVRVRADAWDWFKQYPLKTNTWVGYFEDVPPTMANMNQVIPLEFARYVLLHPDKDPEWREHARELIEWVKTTPKWPKYEVHGATVTTEQGNGVEFCCNLPNQCCDSHTARLAAVEALYYTSTGDAAYRDAAYRSFNWVTYFQGLSGGAHAPFSNQWWFTDEFADGPRRLMDAFWGVPEWAPADESHLLGSSSVVTRVSYRRDSVSYSTFDAESTDVLRLDFAPDAVMADGKALVRHASLDQPGYTFDDKTRVLRVRHANSYDIGIVGTGGSTPPSYITFDDPHVAAGTVLSGQYPLNVIDWGGAWKIHAPDGAFGTFNLTFVDPAASQASLKFPWPRVFVGIDVFNGGSQDATVTLVSDGARDAGNEVGNHEAHSRSVTFTIKPGQVQRLRTSWDAASSSVRFDVTHGEVLRFDNLAYLTE